MVTIERAEVGFQGYYKVGEWTRLRLWVRANSPCRAVIVVEAPDADDNLAVQPGPPIALDTGEQPIEACFRTGRLAGDLSFRLEDPEGNILNAGSRLRISQEPEGVFRRALRLDDRLWGVLGRLPPLGPARENAVSDKASSREAPGESPRIVTLTGPDDIPFDARAGRSLDLLAMTTSKTTAGLSPLSQLLPEHDARLRAWVHAGGHLLLSIGAEAESFTQSPLALWVPIVVEGRVALRQLHGLEKFSGVTAPLRHADAATAARLAPLPSRNTLVQEGAHPLAVSVPYGFGRVTVLGLDIDRPPLSTWSALPQVLEKLAGAAESAGPVRGISANKQLTHLGISDLATQWQFADEHFLQVERPSLWSVMGLIALYLAIVAPLDWLLVHRLFKRPGLTWLTLPLWVLLATVLAAHGALHANARGRQVNAVDVVDIDASTKAVCERTWLSLYSPDAQRYAVSLEPAPGFVPGDAASQAERHSQLTWLAPPENTIGGLYRNAGVGSGGKAYRFSATAPLVENLPVLQWSTRSLYVESQFELADSLVDAQLEAEGAGQIRGTIAHRLPVALEDCLLVVGGWAYRPRDEAAAIAPGRPWQPGGSQARRRELRALLTGETKERREKGDKLNSTEVFTTTAAYDPLSRDWGDLVRIASFYAAAGEREYTSLGNAGLNDLDLTNLMRLGRGVLIGRIKREPSLIEIDGQPASPETRETFVRFVVPVQHRERKVERVLPGPPK